MEIVPFLTRIRSHLNPGPAWHHTSRVRQSRCQRRQLLGCKGARKKSAVCSNSRAVVFTEFCALMRCVEANTSVLVGRGVEALDLLSHGEKLRQGLACTGPEKISASSAVSTPR